MRATGERGVHLAASPGGHLDLLLAVADVLRDRPTVWVTEEGPRAAALRAGGPAVRELPHLERSPRPLLANIRRDSDARPEGATPAGDRSGTGLVVPFCLLARLTGPRVVFVETMARVHGPSASGRILSRRADTVIVQWPEMMRVYRRAILCRPALFEAVASEPSREGQGTFVALGLHDAPFDRLLAAVDRALDVGVLEPPVIVQAGPSGYRSRNFEAVPYLSPDQVRDAVSRARHVVCHAGAGIISTSLRSGPPSAHDAAPRRSRRARGRSPGADRGQVGSNGARRPSRGADRGGGSTSRRRAAAANRRGRSAIGRTRARERRAVIRRGASVRRGCAPQGGCSAASALAGSEKGRRRRDRVCATQWPELSCPRSPGTGADREPAPSGSLRCGSPLLAFGRCSRGGTSPSAR